MGRQERPWWLAIKGDVDRWRMSEKGLEFLRVDIFVMRGLLYWDSRAVGFL